jgi:hypothetical protein
MLKKSSAIGAMLAVIAVLGATASDGFAAKTKNPAPAKTCKTLVGEEVTFGEESTRSGADAALDKEISAWETKYNVKAKPQDRKMECKVYLEFLNEYQCKVTANVCR